MSTTKKRAFASAIMAFTLLAGIGAMDRGHTTSALIDFSCAAFWLTLVIWP